MHAVCFQDLKIYVFINIVDYNRAVTNISKVAAL